MKIVFAGTPDFAATALSALLKAGRDIPLVLTQPDRPAGRGMQLQPSPVKRLALAQGIPVMQPTSLRLDGKYAEEAHPVYTHLREIAPDVMVVVAYGLLLPPDMLSIPRQGCLNIHASLLPRWRGAAPIQRAIEAGDSETGITIMQMDTGLDTGPMLLQKSLPILPTDTASSLHDKLAVMGGELIVEALEQLPMLTPVMQDASQANYAAKLRREEAQLDFNAPAQVIAHKIRAFNPFPGIQVFYQDMPLKIWKAEVLSEAPHAVSPGHILSADAQEGLCVACQSGILRLTELQKPGGKRLPAAEFMKGFTFTTDHFG